MRSQLLRQRPYAESCLHCQTTKPFLCHASNNEVDYERTEFNFRPVKGEDVAKIVNSLPSNKAPGHDQVTARVLKNSLSATLPIITNLINNPFSSNTFAQAWKSAEVIPIPKSGDHKSPANTRRIALLLILTKTSVSETIDSIQHDLLLLKLQEAGLSDGALAWFKSYLFQRNQVVRH